MLLIKILSILIFSINKLYKLLLYYKPYKYIQQWTVIVIRNVIIQFVHIKMSLCISSVIRLPTDKKEQINFNKFKITTEFG